MGTFWTTTTHFDRELVLASAHVPEPAMDAFVAGGAPALPYQQETVDWCNDHRTFVLPASRVAGPMRWVGAIDCRLDVNKSVDTLNIEELKKKWPQWFGSNDTTAGDKGKLAQGILKQWRFPDDFIRGQVHSVIEGSLPGGPLHDRDLLIIACGHKPKVAQAHPNQFRHSVVIR